MKIKLTDLHLNRENPRFLDPYGKKTSEEEIFKYLVEYEELNELINSIKNSKFYQIGERIVVTKGENDKYIVLEGNRRIAALKALHGYFSIQYNIEQSIINETSSLDVDVVYNEDDIAPYLATRHIVGSRKWSAESLRNFYFKHYKNGKSINQINIMTSRPKSEIKKYIKQKGFLDFYKALVDVEHIAAPSFFYERIERYLQDLKVIYYFDTTEYYKDFNIRINTSYITHEEVVTFLTEIYESFSQERVRTKEKINEFKIYSRNANQFEDFKITLCSKELKSSFPELNRIYLKLIDQIEIENFIPKQICFESFVGKVPMISDIIDYSIIKESAVVKIVNSTEQPIDSQKFIECNDM